MAVISRLGLSAGCAVGAILLGLSPGYALPGETISVVEAWIQGNPTLGAKPSDRLVVRRSDTPVRQFMFQASPFPVTGIDQRELNGLIRTERFMLYDTVNGVGAEQFEEALRSIYGAEIYTDYRQGQTLYIYPNEASPLSINPDLRLVGEVREGDRFAYWLELASDAQGHIYSGRMAIFLKEDLPLLRDQLEGRSS